MSFYYQISEILKRKPNTVLEIGAGPNVIGSVLRVYGVDYQTVDIDPELNPDYLASVLALPIPDQSFDVVACFQMLEHIPYIDFSKALREIHRVARSYVLLSLPDAKKLYPISIYIPKIGRFNFCLPRPTFKLAIHKFNGQHHWEINKAGFPLRRIKRDIEAAGFQIESTYRPHENTYHRFFCLAKK